MMKLWKVMKNCGFPETKEGYRAVAEFLVDQINTGGIYRSPELQKDLASATPSRIMRMVEDDGRTINSACNQIDREEGKAKGSTLKQMNRLTGKMTTVPVQGDAKIVDGIEVLPAYNIEHETLANPLWTSFKRSYDAWDAKCKQHGVSVKTHPYNKRFETKFD